MKRKLTDSSGYSSAKHLKFSNETECPIKKLRSQVIPNPVLSQSLRIGGTTATRRGHTNTKSHKHDQPTDKAHRNSDKCPRVGTIIEDRYRIKRFLGKGSFGFVCACSDLLAPDLTVAIKFLKYLGANSDKKTLNEISILKKIADYSDSFQSSSSNSFSSSNFCVQPIDLFHDTINNRDCLVFPLYSCNLFEFLKRNRFVPFDMFESTVIFRQLVEAVNFIHSLHIIHTDLKPENVMICDDSFDYCYADERFDDYSDREYFGYRYSNDDSFYYRHRDGSKKRPRLFKRLRNLRIKLIDFGMAVEGSVHRKHCQTRHYRAPEVLLEQEWSFGVDLWSAGCILFELVTGRTIFMPDDNYEHLFLIQRFLGDEDERSFSPSVIDRCDRRVRKKYFRRNGELRKRDFGDCVSEDGEFADGCGDGGASGERLRPLKDVLSECGDECDGSKRRFRLAVSLVKRLMKCNFKKRLSAADALKHAFFDV